jgi:NTE family protein
VNADLASDADRIVLVAPFRGPEHNPLGPTLDEEVAALETSGVRVLVIAADEASTAAFGSNPLDAASRAPSARAGRRQASEVVAAVQDLWRS